MKHIISIILFTFSFHISFADSVGKVFDLFKNESTFIKIVDENNQQLPVDSICIIFPGYADMAQLNPTEHGRWQDKALDIKNDGYVFYRATDFEVIIFSNSKKYTSKIINRFPGQKLFIFKRTNDHLQDISPLFHEYWYIYFASLFVTLIMETLAGLQFINTQTVSNFLITFIPVNILTHFSAWYIYSNSSESIPILFLELAIVIVESFYWKFFLKSSSEKAFKISALLNLISWISGAAITAII